MSMAKLDWRVVLTIATVAMLLQQAFSYVCQIALPILADRIAEDFGISRAWLGLYLFIQNITAIIAAMACGGFIIRLGAWRVSQICLFLMGTSLLVIASGGGRRRRRGQEGQEKAQERRRETPARTHSWEGKGNAKEI